jgi:hypothetical protein
VEIVYDFKFEFTGSDEASARALTSLYRRLREDESVSGDTKAELVPEARPDGMGAADVLCAALTQLTAIGGLAVAVATWRDARAKIPPLRIRLGKATVEIPGSAVTAEGLAEALHTLAATSEESGPTANGRAEGASHVAP